MVEEYKYLIGGHLANYVNEKNISPFYTYSSMKCWFLYSFYATSATGYNKNYSYKRYAPDTPISTIVEEWKKYRRMDHLAEVGESFRGIDS